MQLPAVIVDVMRCGPGLGGIKPTQGDYYQATRGGGHGDYFTMVLAPGSVQEMFDLTFEAFDLAEKYRNPVLVFADAIIGQMKEPAILEPLREPIKVDKPWALTGAKDRPVRNIRSMYLEGDDQEQLNYTLQRKYNQMRRDEQRSEQFMTEDADVVLVAFGISARIALTAVQEAREQGLRVGLFRPISLFPFPVDALKALSERVKKMLVIEMNLGQMVDDVRSSVLHDVTVGFHGRPAGGVPTADEVLAKMKEL
jgi:2-oxoglutarate ferredoxin oxidoreductase subunit alpha